MSPQGSLLAVRDLTVRFGGPQWKNDQGMKEWLVFMQKYYAEGNTKDFFNVYAYAVAQGLVHVLKPCGAARAGP